MNRVTNTFLLAALIAGLSGTGCGTETNPTSGAGTSAAVASAAREMESRDGDDRDDDDRDGRDDERVSYFMKVLNELRAVPGLAPLFERHRVPDPIRYDESAYGLVSLLRAVRISLANGTVTITNRQTGGVIYAAPLADLSSGTFHPENMPGSTTPPAATCTSFSYSGWAACQPNNTQSRTVLTSSPSGCTGGSPVTSQACTYVPPPPPTPATCTSFSYSAWAACQSNNTQTRTVLTSSPSGCTGGSPVTSQACTYVPPACTYTYSAWSACSSSGTQTRTVVSSSPAGCAGTPVLSQSCTPPPPPPTACGTCHAIPPATGKHAFHGSLATCGTCHGTGYSSTAVNSATHPNGVVNVASTPGYDSSTGTCANSCHGSKTW